ncbi:MAG: hypothetical protein PHG64_11285 [Paludibacter sp.]|nr:hypothetical protein [Paludibacter sp.]
MSKKYLRSLLHYVSAVYDLNANINKLKDNRPNPKITTATISFRVFFGFMLKIRSFNKLDDYLENHDFQKLVPRNTILPRIDAVRDGLMEFVLKPLNGMEQNIVKTTIRNKLVRTGTIDGYKVVVFDGVELFESTRKSCENCLTREIN